MPLLVNHDHDQRVGTVAMLYRLDWLDGPWMVANAIVTQPPWWLRKNETKASFGFNVLARGSFTAAEHVMAALVKEISILSPGNRPAEPLAEVLSLRKLESANPQAVVPSDRAAAGKEFYEPRGIIIRRPIGQVLEVR